MFVIIVRVPKSKTRYMLSSIAIGLRCVSCAERKKERKIHACRSAACIEGNSLLLTPTDA
eukprot:1154929-Pelagomonas_calceolata.AAC.1